MVFSVFSSLVRAYLFLVLCSFSFICGISEIIGTEGRRNSLLDKASDMKFKRVANGVATGMGMIFLLTKSPSNCSFLTRLPAAMLSKYYRRFVKYGAPSRVFKANGTQRFASDSTG